MKTCIVVEDEYPARLRMKQLLEEYKESIQLIGEVDTGKKAIDLIQEKQPDVIFLDIQLPDMTGFDVLSKIEGTPLIVFTTAYSEYALKAFESYSIDYLVKPISAERFAKAMDKLLNWGDKSKLDLSLIQEMFLQLKQPKESFSFAIKLKDKILLVDYKNIAFFNAEDKYVNIHLENGKSYLLSKTLTQLSEDLPPEFVRVHRSYIVNQKRVVEIQKFFKGKYKLKLSDVNGTKVLTGETYKELVEKLFGL